MVDSTVHNGENSMLTTILMLENFFYKNQLNSILKHKFNVVWCLLFLWQYISTASSGLNKIYEMCYALGSIKDKAFLLFNFTNKAAMV